LSTSSQVVKQNLFHDDTVTSFFRRLAWSPDGSFVALPTGLYKPSPHAPPLHTLYLYNRHAFNRPAAHVPGALLVLDPQVAGIGG
jgi:chromatin assembly factor 1 subunit B